VVTVTPTLTCDSDLCVNSETGEKLWRSSRGQVHRAGEKKCGTTPSHGFHHFYVDDVVQTLSLTYWDDFSIRLVM
jgi:hypothetical protein